MPIQRKTSAQFASDIANAILNRNNSYDTLVGPIPDIIINPVASVLELQNERIRSVQQLLSLINDGSFTSDDVDAFVRNEGLVRLQGGRSRVTLIFSRAAPPTVDITVKANFPVGTLPDEETGTTIVFLTEADTTMFAASAASYFNPVSQRYELPVNAISLPASVEANVGPNRIVRPLRPLVGFDGVFNRDSAAGGRSAETTDELIARYFISLTGTTPTTPNGITKILRDLFPAVKDSYVVYGNNQFNVRSATDGGAVDVYTIGTLPTTITESIIFTGVGDIMPVSRQPVLNIVSIAGGWVQGTHYVLANDAGPVGGSVRAGDGVYWLPTAPSSPTIGTPLSVTYTYNAIQTNLQSAFGTSEYTAAGRDLLFKQASEIRVVVSAQLRVGAGYSGPTIQVLVNDAIFNALNNYKLGDDLEVSDLQAIARSFTGVDNFIVTACHVVGGSGVGDILINPSQYVRIIQPNLTITLI